MSLTALPTSPAQDDPWSEPKLQATIQLWELNAADESKLRALHTKLQDVEHPWNAPDVILGFATGGNGGFKTTEKRFRKMIQWRLHNKIDELLANYQPNPLMLDNSPMAFLKDYDNDGDPIYLERGGAVDVKGLLNRFSGKAGKEELMRHCIWLREVQSSGAWTDEYERRQGRAIRNITVVYDLKGLCGRHLQPNVLAFFQQFMKLTEDYYPGPIKRMIIIRSPHIFRIGWQTIKHFFSEECRNKMIFADSDYLSVLGKFMDINVLPPCINPNGRGETAVGMPKHMDCDIIPSYIGKGGQGYSPRDSGISEPLPTKEMSSVCSSTDDDDDDDEEEEAANIDMGDLTLLPVVTLAASS